jgi:hypothetical protein
MPGEAASLACDRQRIADLDGSAHSMLRLRNIQVHVRFSRPQGSIYTEFYYQNPRVWLIGKQLSGANIEVIEI